MTTVDAVWRELVTAALLGTDRREPPELAIGELDDVVADAVRPDAASRMLAAVGAVTAARRAAFVPLPPVPPMSGPPADDRPVTPPATSATWRELVREWPVLEDEWMLAVIAGGYRLAPDVLVEALLRHRGDVVRRARVALAGGPRSAWLIEHLPALAARGGERSAPAEAVGSLPHLAIPPELAELLPLDAHTFVRRLLPGFESGAFGQAHRPVLVHLLARCRPEVLPHTAAALTALGVGQALALADLCRLRHRMLDELTPRPS